MSDMTPEIEIHCADHPSLLLRAFVSEFAVPLSTTASPAWLVELLGLDATAPISRSEEVRARVRNLLRHGGYKPTGRGKPASEYLVRAAEQGKLSSINLAVDANNAVSLHSGLPVSVLDLDCAIPPLRVEIAAAGHRYVFNTAGQEIDVSGLLCVADTIGPCGNAVKDAQRTKTSATTTRTVSLIWGSRDLSTQVEAALAWYQEILDRAGVRCTPCRLTPA